MNETLTRALSGAVYISILIVSILYSQITIAVVLLLFSGISIWEFQKLINYKSYRPYLQLAIIGLCFIMALMDRSYQTENQSFLILLLASITALYHCFLAYRLFKLQDFTISNSGFKNISTLLYTTLPFAFLILIPSVINDTYNPYILLGILIIIWCNDTFAYLVGRQFGKNKLFEKISPKKTIEGFIGGLVFGMISAIIISISTESLSIVNWIVISLITAVTGATGDLIASKFKREAGVKDSSNLIPGHGGFLDRLDSLIFVSSFIYIYLQIISYVS